MIAGAAVVLLATGWTLPREARMGLAEISQRQVRPGPVTISAPRIGPPTAPVRSTPVDTLWMVGEELRPRAAYGSFARARDSLEVLIRRSLGAFADSASWGRRFVRFTYQDRLTILDTGDGYPQWVLGYRDTADRVPSLEMSLNCSTGHCPNDMAISGSLDNAGWEPDPTLSADGPGSTQFCYACREALCFVDSRWDGGDEADSTYVASPGFYLHLLCVPRPPRNPELARQHR